MKKLFLIAIAFTTLQAVAQDGKKRASNEMRKERMAKLQDLSPEEMATLKSKKLTLALDLSDKQQNQVKALFLDEAKTRKAKMEAHKKMKESGALEKLSKEERYEMKNERLDAQIAFKQQMKSILSEEQFQKWEKSQRRRHHKSKNKDKRPQRH
ncbi:MAG: hypothetical protein GYB32_03380 [Algicola sp.]|nr:hypothetical protein [Algicola sp.]